MSDFKTFTEVPAWYPVRIVLGGNAGARKTGAKQLRPETFVCHRITWATTGDIIDLAGFPLTMGSTQGRSVRVSFGDSFTRFFGRRSALVSAVFGDSQGFLDLPRGVLFQGSQAITVELERLFWPAAGLIEIIPEQDTVWDFVFAGVGLLPHDVNQSGSAG